MKSMKKSMVITTVLMVLLLIVALSTATFAWYSAQNNASVTRTTVSSAESNTASLVVDYAKVTNKNSTQSSVSLTMTTNVKPMMLNLGKEADLANISYADFIKLFKTYTVDNAANYSSLPEGATPGVITTVVGSTTATQDEFWVTNVGGVNANITANVEIITEEYIEATDLTGGTSNVKGYFVYNSTSDKYEEVTEETALAVAGTDYFTKSTYNSNLRVALFANRTLVSIWGGETRFYEFPANNTGLVVGGTPEEHTALEDYVTDSAESIASNVAPMAGVNIQVVAWFEGDMQANADAGTNAYFTISFGATASPTTSD